MHFTIIFKPRARRDLQNIDRRWRERIAVAIDRLASQPRPPNCKKLAGADELWRIRVGDYRIIYQIDDELLVVLLVRIGHRRDVYD